MPTRRPTLSSLLLALLLVLLPACGAADVPAQTTSAPAAQATSGPAATAVPATTTAATAAAIAATGASTAAATAAGPQPLRIIATYSILGDLVQNVVGDTATVQTLVGPDGDPHVYEPTPSDSAALAEADLIFENGLAFETWIDDLYNASGSQAERVVATERIEPLVAGEGPSHAADEAPSMTHRLVVADAEAGRVAIVDPASGQTLDTFAIDGPAYLSTSADGRYAFAVQYDNNRVAAIDSGIYESDHGDHAHVRAKAPKLLAAELQGANPSHLVVHGGQAAIFFDGDGVAKVYQLRELRAAEPSPIILQTERPHHGVAVPLGNAFLISMPDPAAEEDGELPIGMAVVDATGARQQEFADCPDLHGEAALGTAAAFACADGVLLIEPDGAQWSARKLAYPQSSEAEARVWSLAAHEAQPYLFGGFAQRSIMRLDTRDGAATTFALPGDVYEVALDRLGGTRLVVLTADGQLHRLDPESGAVLGSVAATSPFDLEDGELYPSLTVSENVAYVSDPTRGEVAEVLLDGMTIDRRIAVDGAPGQLVLAGLLDEPVLLTPASDEEHSHDEDEHSHGEYDPHVWNDPNNAMAMVEAIRDALVAADSANAATYAANAEAYLAQLRELDAFVQQETDTLPAERRKLVTTHDTFGYFAERYGYEVVGTALGSVSTEAADPAAGEIAELVNEIQAASVPAIFAESSNNGQLMERIAQAAGVRLAPPLYPEALSPPDGPAPTYLDLVRYNVQTIVTALAN
jgi:ABC-type Zn uptake system ZnuABC Zn-binding protein ZnuA